MTRRYRITDKKGRELGEGEGSTRPKALLALYRMAKVEKVALSPSGRRLWFLDGLPNVDGVRFERLA